MYFAHSLLLLMGYSVHPGFVLFLREIVIMLSIKFSVSLSITPSTCPL
jgi:hypothetical protein